MKGVSVRTREELACCVYLRKGMSGVRYRVVIKRIRDAMKLKDNGRREMRIQEGWRVWCSGACSEASKGEVM